MANGQTMVLGLTVQSLVARDARNADVLVRIQYLNTMAKSVMEWIYRPGAVWHNNKVRFDLIRLDFAFIYPRVVSVIFTYSYSDYFAHDYF